MSRLQDVGARQRDDAIDGGFGGGGDPADVLGHQRAGAADLSAASRRASPTSCQTVARSTVGAAGFSLARTTVTKTTTISVATEKRIRLAFLRFATSGERGTSIDESSPQDWPEQWADCAFGLCSRLKLCASPRGGQQHIIDERLRAEVASIWDRGMCRVWDRSSRNRTVGVGTYPDPNSSKRAVKWRRTRGVETMRSPRRRSRSDATSITTSAT